MQIYKIGDVIPGFIGHDDGTLFDIDDSGASLILFYNNPDQREISQFEAGKTFDIRYTVIRNIVMITAKIGELNWIDAPYTPHLSKELTTLQIPDDDQGISLVLYLIDGANGQIKHMRLLGLSEKFSRSLIGTVLDIKIQPFDQYAYNQSLQYIYSAYTTKQIVNLSKDFCKFY